MVVKINKIKSSKACDLRKHKYDTLIRDDNVLRHALAFYVHEKSSFDKRKG